MRTTIVVLLLTTILGLNLVQAAEILISDKAGQTMLRLYVYEPQQSKDIAELTRNGGQSWQQVFTGVIDQIRLRSGEQAQITGQIPKRILVTALEPKEEKAPSIPELEFAAGNLIYKFQDYNHLKFGTYPRPPGVIEKTNLYEIYQKGEARDGLFLFSVKTSEGLTATWLVRQMGWKAILVNRIFEKGLYETSAGLKNGRHRHIELIKDQGFDTYEINAAFKETWPHFFAEKPKQKPRSQFARMFLEEIRGAIKTIQHDYDYPDVEFSVPSIDRLKELIREIEKDIGHYDEAAKKRMVERIAVAFETKILLRLQQQTQQQEQAQRQGNLPKAAEDALSQLLRDLNQNKALRCELIF